MCVRRTSEKAKQERLEDRRRRFDKRRIKTQRREERVRQAEDAKQAEDQERARIAGLVWHDRARDAVTFGVNPASEKMLDAIENGIAAKIFNENESDASTSSDDDEKDNTNLRGLARLVGKKAAADPQLSPTAAYLSAGRKVDLDELQQVTDEAMEDAKEAIDGIIEAWTNPLKVIVDWAQITSSFTRTFDIPWPETFVRFVGAGQFVVTLHFAAQQAVLRFLSILLPASNCPQATTVARFRRA